MSPRDAFARWVTGLWRTIARSQPGTVSSPDEELLAKVRWHQKEEAGAHHRLGRFTFMPKMIQIHDRGKAKESSGCLAISTIELWRRRY